MTGDYLDSVAAPKIQVILDYKNTDDTRKELVFQDVSAPKERRTFNKNRQARL